jgi:hypothetical protein
LTEFLIRTRIVDRKKPRREYRSNCRKNTGILIIELDENVIKNELFPNLAKKYFSESETANYRLAVVNRSGEAVFQTEN